VRVVDPGGSNVATVESLGVGEDESDWALRQDRTRTDDNSEREREHDRRPEYER
jgi:hypothetical protein